MRSRCSYGEQKDELSGWNPAVILQYIYYTIVLLQLEGIARWLSNQILLRRTGKTVFIHSQLMISESFLDMQSVLFLFVIYGIMFRKAYVLFSVFPPSSIFSPSIISYGLAWKQIFFPKMSFCTETISYCISGLSVQGQWILRYIYYLPLCVPLFFKVLYCY